jgi:DUF438 domain-containing protein
MQISASTRLDDLLRAYPFLRDRLVALSPKFAKLNNPILRRTVGKLATLGQAAGLADMPVDDLLKAIAAAIEPASGERVSVAAPVGAAGSADGAFRDKEARLEVLKDIIRDLHAGEDIGRLRKRFADLVKDLGPTEIPEMEQRLIAEGMPESEVKRLCDVHVQVFQEALAGTAATETVPGHPLHTLAAENRVLEGILEALRKTSQELKFSDEGFTPGLRDRMIKTLDRLREIDKHFLKKENQLFPLLEDKGVSGPSKVMWAIHDDIRAHLKAFRGHVEAGRSAEASALGLQLETELRDMITKEEKILFPMAVETLGDRDWARVKHGEESVGYAWITPGTQWRPAVDDATPIIPSRKHSDGAAAAEVALDTGAMSPEMLNLVLKHLPLDISVVGADDAVLYYSEGPERIFPRSPAVIGRKVQNCHPPASVHVVERILAAFKDGSRDVAEFWIRPKDRVIHIRYFAVRDADRTYRGCLEVSQDVTAIHGLQGERRLLDWD